MDDEQKRLAWFNGNYQGLITAMHLAGMIDLGTFNELLDRQSQALHVVTMIMPFSVIGTSKEGCSASVTWMTRVSTVRSPGVQIKIDNGEVVLTYEGVDNPKYELPWLKEMLHPILGTLMSGHSSRVISVQRASWVIGQLGAFSALLQAYHGKMPDQRPTPDPMPE